MMRHPKDAQEENDTAAFFLRLFSANAHTARSSFFQLTSEIGLLFEAKISYIYVLMYRANRAVLAVAAKKLVERTNSLYVVVKYELK